MNRTLRYGSVGQEVSQLQQGLNLMPSNFPKLKADGIYGAKTITRVKEFQSNNGLVPDGIAGPLTWARFLQLLEQVQKGGIPPIPKAPPSVVDALRPLVLTIAQKYLGVVDFQQMQGGRPKGIDFLIEMFQFVTGVTLTEANFISPKTKAWTPVPWYPQPGHDKDWCAIFCVYCYRKAGLNVSWNLGNGKPYGSIKLNTFSAHFVANIRPADLGCVASQNHHFMIESVDGSGPAPRLTTIDANQIWGRIVRIWSKEAGAHRVGHDNFNYYSFV